MLNISDSFPLVTSDFMSFKDDSSVTTIRDNLRKEIDKLEQDRKITLEALINDYDSKKYFPEKRKLRQKCESLGHRMVNKNNDSDGDRVLKICSVCGIVRQGDRHELL